MRVDLLEDGIFANPALLLAHGALGKPRRLEGAPLSQVEAVLNRRLDRVQIRDGLVEPAECLSRAGVDRLEVLDIVDMRRHARSFVLPTHLVEQ